MAEGLDVKSLTLIDPDLNISETLHDDPRITGVRGNLENFSVSTADTAYFKQSFHLVYNALGKKIFDQLPDHIFVLLYMPRKPEWPMSPEFKSVYESKELDPADIAKDNGKTIIKQMQFDYPVQIERDEWCDMIDSRFTTPLYDVTNGFIENEKRWAEQNLPQTVGFKDSLKCLVFK